jgi:hypothetical protein
MSEIISSSSTPFAAPVTLDGRLYFKRAAHGVLPITITAAECDSDPEEALSIVSGVLARRPERIHAVVHGVTFYSVAFGVPTPRIVKDDLTGICKAVTVSVPLTVDLITDAAAVAGSATEADALFDDLIAADSGNFLVSLHSLPYFHAYFHPTATALLSRK